MKTGLDNRGDEPKGAESFHAERQRMKATPKAEADTGGPSLAERIQAARELRPPTASATLHCGCCWGAGRDAAIRAIEGSAGAPPVSDTAER